MVVVIPLLVEKKLWEPFDRAIVVDCSKENQISRLMAREKIDKERAEFMLLTQSSRKQRLKLGDKLPTDIIENDSRISDLKAKIDSLSQKLFSLL
ncbi:MAG: dephospho-CoA kinase, partial [Gammaproteobacteria bacterium]|nr:dephospho-CoA kinase [Gammaproteobacteria bacterium]